MSKSREEEINGRLGEMTKEAAGIIQVSFCWQDDIPLLVLDALGGDLTALKTLEWVAAVVTALDQGECLCLFCDETPVLDDVQTMAIMRGSQESAVNALSFVICRDCAKGERNTLMKRTRDRLVDGFTGLRPIDVHPSAGRA